MTDITVTMRPTSPGQVGQVRRFKHSGRAGGSYTKSLTIEGPFAVIKDEWGKKTYIPCDLIEEIETREDCW